MLLSLLSMPLYLRFFDDNIVLGLWFTILSVLNWILNFDLGIGNGLRNNLTEAIVVHDYKKCKSLISSAYFMLGALSIVVYIICIVASLFINWNSFFNVSTELVSNRELTIDIVIVLSGIIISFLLRIVNSIIYALQKPAINNFIHLLTSVFIVCFLVIAPSRTVEQNLRNISLAYSLIINIPLLLVTVLVFTKSILKDCKPHPSYISKTASKSVMSLGIVFLMLQILYMIITVTNEWFIGKFFGTQYCVDYQVYYRIFSIFSTIFTLALTPLWSAITAAKASKNYNWIKKLVRLLYLIVLAFSILQVLVIPFLQEIVNFWLKDNAIAIDKTHSLIFCIYSIMFLWVGVQSTIVSGLGRLKVQLIWYTFAVFFKIAFIIILSRIGGSWIIVILGTILGLVPYSIIQPLRIKKEIKYIYEQ